MIGIADKHPGESAQQVIGRFSKVGTIDLRIDYLRPGLGKYFVASAKVTRIGGRIASTQMELHNDEGLLLSTGAASYIVS
jgi:acyl-coenzyme A thioesterase PaaI-like protein